MISPACPDARFIPPEVGTGWIDPSTSRWIDRSSASPTRMPRRSVPSDPARQRPQRQLVSDPTPAAASGRQGAGAARAEVAGAAASHHQGVGAASSVCQGTRAVVVGVARATASRRQGAEAPASCRQGPGCATMPASLLPTPGPSSPTSGSSNIRYES